MQRGRGRGDLFDSGDPFTGFGGFADNRSLMSGFFGGRDPFEDPFFTRPFGSMFGSSMFGPSMFGPSMFGPGGSPFGDSSNSGFFEHQAPRINKSKGPVIVELSSDDEESKDIKERGDGPQKNLEPRVEDPDDEIEERKMNHVQIRNEYNRANAAKPQSQTYTFQSSSVTYGGANGPYYTSSTARRMGGDGVMVEEKREADTTTGKAAHRLSRGIHNKGHSVTRKLNSDGNVNTVQTLHNMNEDELAGFEEHWKGSAGKHLAGWNQEFDPFNNGSGGSRGSGQNGQASRGWALPSTEGRARSHTVNVPVSYK